MRPGLISASSLSFVGVYVNDESKYYPCKTCVRNNSKLLKVRSFSLCDKGFFTHLYAFCRSGSTTLLLKYMLSTFLKRQLRLI